VVGIDLKLFSKNLGGVLNVSIVRCVVVVKHSAH
jgi:hypothetical protein